ncbi:MAG TPA: tyrosine-type recombinase/integrase [Pseudonocardia sp.]|nr:tyrosine-type recombinase/integrase [Pseudonocardia sp.]
MAKPVRSGRDRGSVERRGGSFRVKVYAGLDPQTGRRLYLTGSASTQREAERIRTKLQAEVDAKRATKTRATLNAAIDDWLRLHEVEESTLAGYRGYLDRTIRPALGAYPVQDIDEKKLEELYADLRRCSQRCRDGQPEVDHRTAAAHDCRVVRHRRPPGRPRDGGVHDCSTSGCTLIECPPHHCKPMAASTIRQVHSILSSIMGAAVRWKWIDTNPCSTARKPRQPIPNPDPPSTADAARIVEAAAQISDDWGMFVWLVFMTGMRRAEAVALRWSNINLKARTLLISHNWIETPGGGREKDTKTHQERTIALDKATAKLLKQHRKRYEQDMAHLEAPVSEEAYVFSYSPSRDRPYSPSGVTHKYTRMCADLGIKSHLHALRHYSATELLSSGVDLRTVAGRLGHGGGGSTTLRVYTKFVTEADRKAADLLGSHLRRRQ